MQNRGPADDLATDPLLTSLPSLLAGRTAATLVLDSRSRPPTVTTMPLLLLLLIPAALPLPGPPSTPSRYAVTRDPAPRYALPEVEPGLAELLTREGGPESLLAGGGAVLARQAGRQLLAAAINLALLLGLMALTVQLMPVLSRLGGDLASLAGRGVTALTSGDLRHGRDLNQIATAVETAVDWYYNTFT